MMMKELEKVAIGEFYAILRKVSDIGEEEVRDEAHAISLYKELMLLEIEQEKINLDEIPKQDSNNSFPIEADPELIAVRCLSTQLAVFDRIKVQTGYSRQTILTFFKKLKLSSNAEIAEFHYKLKKDAMHTMFSLGGELEFALKMEVNRAIEQGSIVKSFEKVPIFTFEEYCVITYIATKFAVIRVKSEAK